jgi:hypothetical protein
LCHGYWKVFVESGRKTERHVEKENIRLVLTECAIVRMEWRSNMNVLELYQCNVELVQMGPIPEKTRGYAGGF